MDSYYNYRKDTQDKIDNRLELLVFECWNYKKVDLATYNRYLKFRYSSMTCCKFVRKN